MLKKEQGGRLAALLVSLNLLAFALHTVCDKAEESGAGPGRRPAHARSSSAISRRSPHS